MTSNLLTASGVSKRFGANTVLRDIHLSVAEHDVVCLIGASGCGKSTFLRCINGLEQIDGGEITLEGERISGPGVDLDWLRRIVGIVFQGYNLFPHMNVLQNITLAPRKVLGLPANQANDVAESLLRRIGLWDKAHTYPDQLSGGQQQRLAIVRALAMGPRLMLLDEVTSALDPELVGEVLSMIRGLASDGMTMLIATHEMTFAREVSSLVCFMDEGQICEIGPPDQLLTNPTNPRTRAFLRRIIDTNHLEPTDAPPTNKGPQSPTPEKQHTHNRRRYDA